MTKTKTAELAPNPYEAPTCQEAKEVRRKKRPSASGFHARSTSFECGRLDFQLRFCRSVSCAKHLSKVYAARAAETLAMCSGGQFIGRALETIAFPHAGPIKETG
jgi:hypothetical protein